MKKIVLLFVIINSFIYSIEKEYELVSETILLKEDFSKKIDIYTEEGVEYISLNDLKEILELFYGKFEIEAFENKRILKSLNNNLMISFLLKENRIIFNDKSDLLHELIKKYRNEVIKLKFDNGMIDEFEYNFTNELYEINEESYTKSILNKNIDLKRYKLEFLNKNDNLLIPYFLVNYYFFNNFITFYKKSKKILILDPKSFNEYIHFRGVMNAKIPLGNFKPKMKDKLKYITYIHFLELLKYEYLLLKERNIDVKYLEDKYINDLISVRKNSDYYYKFRDIIKTFNDPHTTFRSYGTSLIKRKNWNNEYMKRVDELKRSERKSEIEITDLDEKTVYFYLPSWMLGAQKEYQRKLGEKTLIEILTEVVEKSKDKNLIFDIRWNGGGYLINGMYFMSFLADKNTIFYSRTNTDKIIKNLIPIKENKNINLVVLTNDQSYSASNDFAYLVKLNKVGKVIGEKTMGGAASTVPFILPDNSVIGLSAGQMYVLPENNGEKTIEFGIEPDIYVDDIKNEKEDKILEAAIEYLKEN